jgi:hypothetical protein
VAASVVVVDWVVAGGAPVVALGDVAAPPESHAAAMSTRRRSGERSLAACRMP